MTLESIYLNNDPRADAYRVVIGGVNVPAVLNVSYAYAHSKVPTCSIRLRAALVPATAIFNASVQVEKGFNGITTRVFTGTVLNLTGDERAQTIECQGMSAPLDNNYHKVVVTADGTKTVHQLIDALFAAAEIAHYHVDLPAYTPGTVAPQTVTFATYGEAINKLAEIDGGRWYELPDGTVRVDVREPVPAPTSWRTYFSGVLTGIVEGYPTGIVSGRPRLRRITYTQQARDVKNQCWVRGAVVTSTNPDLTQDSITIEEHAYADSPWVVNGDGSQAYNDELFPNQFIDTAVKAGLVAGRRVAVTNRLMTQVGAEIDGDPQVMLGLTCNIEDPAYSGTTGRWFVEGYKSEFSPGKFTTQLTAIGGPEAGATINVVPFAFFTHAVDREVMGDREWCLLGLDGSGSVDPDGTIVSWAWSDNLGLVAGATAVLTQRVDAALISSPWEITLTVTDNLGATDTLTLPISFAASAADVYIPAMFLAFDADASGSPDGGINWYDQVLAGCISTSAKAADGVNFGIGVYGTSAGAIYRTTDYAATAPTLVMAAVGSPMACVWWDIVVKNRVWACTEDAKLYVSLDDAATWALYEDCRVKFGIATLRLNSIGTPVAGGVWIWGGTGTGYPFYAWDAVCDHNWGVGLIAGELEADLLVSGHPADVYIIGAANGGDCLAIILNSATHTPAVYTSLSGGLDGNDWKRALGDAGALAKSRGKWVCNDVAGQYVVGFNDNLLYNMPIVAGVGTIALAPATLDAGDVGNHILALYWWTGIEQAYLLAAERMSGTASDGTLYKTWDRFANVDKARPAPPFPACPAGARGKMIAIGPPGLVEPGRVLATTTSASPREATHLTASSWSALVAMTGVTDNNPYPFCATPTNWFCTNEGVPAYTKNTGISWAALSASLTGDAGIGPPQAFCRDAGGRIWAIVGGAGALSFSVWYSDDEGDNWTVSIADTGFGTYVAMCIAAHPSNQNMLFLFGTDKFMHGFTRTTINRGVSWTETLGGTRPNIGTVGVPWAFNAAILSNGRFVASGVLETGGATRWCIMISDDLGVTWTTVYSEDDASVAYLGLGATFGGKVVVWREDNAGNFGRPLVSTNYATSFGIVSPSQTLQDFVGAAVAARDTAYDAESDTLYVSTNIPAFAVCKLTPMDASGVWSNMKLNIATTTFGMGNLAAIPHR